LYGLVGAAQLPGGFPEVAERIRDIDARLAALA
jgi:hypothetical protein